MLLVARHTPKEKLSKTLPVQEANFVEQFLISRALSKNNDLMNKRDTKLLRELKVPGVLNSPPGNPGGKATLLRSVLGI